MTVNDLKTALPVELLDMLSDDKHAGALSDEVLQKALNEAVEYLSKRGYDEELLIVYQTASILYARNGFKEQSDAFHKKVLDYMVKNEIFVSSKQQILDDTELERW
ncbi:MAG: hypothetical protein ACP5G8_03510 [Athalassotoga sp.]